MDLNLPSVAPFFPNRLNNYCAFPLSQALHICPQAAIHLGPVLTSIFKFCLPSPLFFGPPFAPVNRCNALFLVFDAATCGSRGDREPQFFGCHTPPLLSPVPPWRVVRGFLSIPTPAPPPPPNLTLSMLRSLLSFILGLFVPPTSLLLPRFFFFSLVFALSVPVGAVLSFLINPERFWPLEGPRRLFFRLILAFLPKSPRDLRPVYRMVY